jgi:hypothetical protein
MALLVSVLGASAILAARLRTRSLSANADAVAAQFYAQSAIALGRYCIAADTNWRSDYATSTHWVVGVPVGGPPSNVNTTTTTTQTGGINLLGLHLLGGSTTTSTTTFTPNNNAGAIDLDVTDTSGGPIPSNATSPVLLTATGYKGRAKRRLQVQLYANASPMSCLAVATDISGSVNLSSCTITGSSTVSSNSSMTFTSCTLNSTRLESASTVTALLCTPSSPPITNNASPRTFPDASTFNSNFSYYLSHGAYIDFAQIPTVLGVKTLDRKLISPITNPYPVSGQAATNSEGIYIIDCNSSNLTISNCRLVGTLVLINSIGAGPVISGSHTWEPAVPNYPVLIVKGSLTFKPTNTALSESTAPAVNFNPTGVPYPYTTTNTDSDTTDTYPSQQNGLIYCSGSLTTGNHPVVKGVIVAGSSGSSGLTCTWSSSGTTTLDLTYDNSYYNNPPPGFCSQVKMLPTPGTWKQLTN